MGAKTEREVKLPQIRVPESLHDRLVERARAEDRSLTATMRTALRRYCDSLVTSEDAG